MTEDFARWRVLVDAVAEGRPPDCPGPLEKAVERLKPAHLEFIVTPRGELPVEGGRISGLTGGALTEVTGDDALRGGSSRGAALSGGLLAEVWEAAGF